MLKVIRTQKEHEQYLSEVESLITNSEFLSIEEAEKLELLTVLINDYENSKYPIEQIDPIDAIKFRMNEKGLKQVDLAPYFGNKSRVSEVLNRKRPLTVQMIRALSVGLGISADTLIGVELKARKVTNDDEMDWFKFPYKEMSQRGWLENFSNQTNNSIEDTVKSFISQFGEPNQYAAFRRTIRGDSYSPVTQYSLYAWTTRVIQKARKQKLNIAKYKESILSSDFLTELAHISWLDSGPLLAKEFLEKNGICLVIVPALKGTLVDGAAMKDSDGMPIVALTLRHDRLDNFWFTLMHELVHIWKHVKGNETFIDDIEHSSEDKIEAEANRITKDIFIPRAIWRRSDAYLSPSKSSIDFLSRELRIHPAIIAGRIRKESGDYTKFSDLVGHGDVRIFFEQREEIL